MKIDRRVRIDATPEALWPLLTEPELIMRWNPSIVSNEPTEPGPVGVGSRWTVQIREGGKLVPYVSEVTLFEPVSRLEIRLTGGGLGASPMPISYHVTPSGDGVELAYSARWAPVGVWLRLMAPLISIMANRNTSAALNRLKQLAENGE